MESAWIFAYGSLLWDPGFEYEESRPATIYGYHRRFCIYSHIYRGTPKRPGLVFGLDRGGSCRGRVFRVAPDAARQVLGMIWDREMVYRVYLPRTLSAHAEEDRIECRTFVANPSHEQYAGKMDVMHTAAMIAGASGKAGANSDYLENTLSHLQELGLQDGRLLRLRTEVRRCLDERRC
ncbi:MAG: gamma-glutamylcyclotransferase [Alphaproteobacteria bacterium]|nr:gamma-glutamylcyclotransferase [Alphaproteobacteria bacterium]